MTPPDTKIWTCTIGEIPRAEFEAIDFTHLGDKAMRDAVESAYRMVTGQENTFVFSGWGARLDEAHRAVVENRMPERPSSWRDMAEMLGELIEEIRPLLSGPLHGAATTLLEKLDRLKASDPV